MMDQTILIFLRSPVMVVSIWLAAVAFSSALAAEPHWAFRNIARLTPPQVKQADWPRNEIDSFILCRLDQENISPSRLADRVTLMRRVTLDLIGLPPTVDQVDEFDCDERPDAYQRLVDRLIASPQYGERWTRPWLDLCHYGDSDGHLTDQLRPVAWRYRDWVTRMLNANLPFDEFTIRQLAGDLLVGRFSKPSGFASADSDDHANGLENRPTSEDLDLVLGTGFLRQTLSNREGGADLEEFRVAQIVDRTSMVGTIWLGLTVGCARCHDHKYDPLTQAEFYKLYAFFDTADEVNIDAPLPDEAARYQQLRPDYERRRQELVAPFHEGLIKLQRQWETKCLFAAEHPGGDHVWDRQWELLGLIWGGGLGEGQLEGCEIVRRPWDKRTPRQQDDLLDYFLQQGSIVDPKLFAELELPELQKQLGALKKEFAAAQATRAPIMQAAFIPRQTYIHERGDFRSRGADVSPGIPACAQPDSSVVRGQETRAQRIQHAGGEPPRLALARWLVSRDNPLTARVTVNRMWQEFLGRGLVVTSDDLGTRGDRPSHPELLDWLADEFMRSDWDVKRTHRLIVTSATYRQSSKPRNELAMRDPGNELLARQSSLRVPAETVRDAALAVSGLISTQLGGPSVFPPQHERVTMEAFGSNSWKTSAGSDRFRRGLYTFILRTSPFAQSITFDAPAPVAVCTRRDRSNTPLQALTLLNDPVFGELSAAFADRIVRESGPTGDDRIRRAVRLCLSRDPTDAEVARLKQYLQAHQPQDNQVAWMNLASVLLNLHEFITRD